MVNPRLEEVKIVEIGKTSSKSVPHIHLHFCEQSDRNIVMHT